jgi:hypothetical protein
MKRIKIIGASAFLLALGIAGPVVAGQEKPDRQEEKAKPQKQEEKGKASKQEPPAKPERQPQEKPAKQEQPQAKSQQTQRTHQTQESKQQQDNSAKQQARTGKQEQQAKPEKRQEAKTQQQGGSARPPERTQEAKARQQSHRVLRLSERGSGRIPEERFHSNFGREHNFRMQEPVLVGGHSRFQYGGYWFGFVEPWPADWYYTDDFYIDYVDGGYYMYDPYYPGTRFAISVVI